jgi:hypothetical protein
MWEYHAISHARDIPFYELTEMEASVERCHRLFGKKQIMNDMLYMLRIINYGELQKSYKGV